MKPGLRLIQPRGVSEQIDQLYDLMDAAYEAPPIYEVSRSLGRVPIIDENGRGQGSTPLVPHEAARYMAGR